MTMKKNAIKENVLKQRKALHYYIAYEYTYVNQKLETALRYCNNEDFQGLKLYTMDALNYIINTLENDNLYKTSFHDDVDFLDTHISRNVLRMLDCFKEGYSLILICNHKKTDITKADIIDIHEELAEAFEILENLKVYNK